MCFVRLFNQYEIKTNFFYQNNRSPKKISRSTLYRKRKLSVNRQMKLLFEGHKDNTCDEYSDVYDFFGVNKNSAQLRIVPSSDDINLTRETAKPSSSGTVSVEQKTKHKMRL